MFVTTPSVPIVARPPHPARSDARAETHEEFTGFSLGQGLLERVLDEIDYGLMVLSARQRVLFANRAARLLCDTPGSPCRWIGAHLRLTDPVEQEALDRALQMAAFQSRRNLLRATQADQSLLLATVPLFARKPGPSASGRAEHPDGLPPTEGAGGDVLVLFSRRQTCEALSVEFFARAFGLTHAETAVLNALCSGTQPAQIAQQLGVAVSTVRTQVSSIRQKTGAGSIGELVRQVAVLPPIVPAVTSTAH